MERVRLALQSHQFPFVLVTQAVTRVFSQNAFSMLWLTHISALSCGQFSSFEL